jgi:hypothetical protein
MQSFADFDNANLQNIQEVQASLRSQTTAISCMSFADLQICFLSVRAKLHEFFHLVEQMSSLVENVWKSPSIRRSYS